MKYIQTFFFTTIVLGLVNYSSAQTTKLSLQDAVEYANKNHPSLQNKLLDEKYADAQVKEVRSIGLPHVNLNTQFLNNLQKQVFVFPINNVPTPIRVGNTYNTTATLEASWLALDASYFLGLKAASAFTDFAKLQTTISARDISINVTKAYYIVLVTNENIGLLEQNVKTFESVLFQTEGYFKNGLVEKLDVDRLQLNLSNLKVELGSFRDAAVIAEQFLKMNMGMPVETEIELTDNLESLYKTSTEDLTKTFNPKLRLEYQLLQNQLTLNNLDKRRIEVSKYPNLVVFANYQQNNFGEKIDYSTWYGNSFWGFRIGVPLFSGFNYNAQLKKRSIAVKQTLNSIQFFENASTLEANQALTKFNRGLKTIEIQKKNLDLANEILRVSSAKLKEGIGSNLEITSAQQEVKTSQTNYLNAIFDLLNAQIELKKAYGKL